MGGADPDNATLKVIRALDKVDVADLEVVAVLGAENPHHQSVQHAVDSSRHSARLSRNAASMPELMAWADVAISAVGTTCWELAFMGLPSLAVVIAKNQRYAATRLDEAKLLKAIGSCHGICNTLLAAELMALMHDRDVREGWSRSARRLVTGLGGREVIRVLCERSTMLSEETFNGSF